MELTAQSLLALQRLARVVKKECKKPVSISRQGGIDELLKLAVQNNQNESIGRAYHEFISSLTEQQSAELGIGGHGDQDGNIPEDAVDSRHHDTTNSIYYDRRQRNIPVAHDRRKKVVYRGVVMYQERRQQQLPIDGPDRRGTGEPSVENVKIKETLSDSHDMVTVKVYRGVEIKDDEPAEKRGDSVKGTRIYRGFSTDDEQPQ